MNFERFLNQDSQEDEAQDMDNIRDTGMPSKIGDSPIACISIIGQIEGHNVLPPQNKSTKYEHILPMLLAAEQNEQTKAVLLLLNTMGGDVEAGLAISEMVASLSKPTASLVIGGSHSIGVPLAVSAARSFIVPSATMTIHPVRISGLVITAEQSFDYMRNMQARVARFVVEHSGISMDRFYEFLSSRDEMANDIGSILSGKEAVECGLIDEIGGLKTVLAYLNKKIKKTDGKKEK